MYTLYDVTRKHNPRDIFINLLFVCYEEYVPVHLRADHALQLQ
jgi:hypothetical protein